MKKLEKALGVETRPGRANVEGEFVRGKPLTNDGESLAEGKPSAGAAKGNVAKVFGAETLRDRADGVGEYSGEGKPSLDAAGAHRQKLRALRAKRREELQLLA